ncbi:MAG: sugar ABC transporter permease, partial [Chloroflexi bacterium]|nr:sugar ABC transporter permease [Chloroflexota bacterium]
MRRPAERFFDTQRGRVVLENLTAYLFLAPTIVLIFLFGLFPVVFAFFVSLHEWRRLPGDYVGLAQYVDALGGVAYVLFFWMGAAALIYAGVMLLRLRRETRAVPRGRLFLILSLIPGVLNTVALLAIINWFFILLPVVLDVPQRLRGQPLDVGMFLGELINSFSHPAPLAAADVLWLLLIPALIGSGVGLRLMGARSGVRYLLLSTFALITAALGALMLQLTVAAVQTAIAEAQAAGETLPIWSQIILISLGAALLFAAYRVWRAAARTEHDRRFFLFGLAALLLIVGGYTLIAELPRALATADARVLQSLNVTVMYSAFSIPFQLVFGLALAILLFQKIRFKSFFRVVFFLPYVMPAVATATIFSLLFSNRPGAPANQFVGALGVEPL